MRDLIPVFDKQALLTAALPQVLWNGCRLRKDLDGIKQKKTRFESPCVSFFVSEKRRTILD